MHPSVNSNRRMAIKIFVCYRHRPFIFSSTHELLRLCEPSPLQKTIRLEISRRSISRQLLLPTRGILYLERTRSDRTRDFRSPSQKFAENLSRSLDCFQSMCVRRVERC